jgi:hypothetical protein
MRWSEGIVMVTVCEKKRRKRQNTIREKNCLF